jgi:hypothetical protein
MVLNTIKSQGLTKYTINLMTMDFGSTLDRNLGDIRVFMPNCSDLVATAW